MGTALPIKLEVTEKQGTAMTPGIAGFGKIGLQTGIINTKQFNQLYN
jgi:hypothetical protein